MVISILHKKYVVSSLKNKYKNFTNCCEMGAYKVNGFEVLINGHRLILSWLDLDYLGESQLILATLLNSKFHPYFLPLHTCCL